MGSRGVVPKRSAEKLGHRTAAEAPDTVVVEGEVEIPEFDADWHPIAKAMYDSLKIPELAQFMLGSDWAVARDAAETLTLAYETKSAELFKVAARKWDSLLLTESARRRAGIEVERRTPESATGDTVSDHRSRLSVVS